MAKKNFTIPASALKKLHSFFKKHEAKNVNVQIGSMKPSNFLVSVIDPIRTRSAAPNISYEVKQIVLYVSGDFSTDPDILPDSTKLKENLNYNDSDYSVLYDKLDALIIKYNPSSGTTSTDVYKCKTAGDCVTLVNSKIEYHEKNINN